MKQTYLLLTTYDDAKIDTLMIHFRYILNELSESIEEIDMVKTLNEGCLFDTLKKTIKICTVYTKKEEKIIPDYLKNPPCELTPRSILDEKRYDEINNAIGLYVDAKKEIPKEWWEEYNELYIKIYHSK